MSAADATRVLESLLAAQARGGASVMVVVASVRGSTPRGAGARMLVTRRVADGAFDVTGTIGGGHLEHQAIGVAQDMLAAGAGRDTRRFALGASLGQCCGGAVELLFEPVAPDAAWPRAAHAALARGAPCVLAYGARGGMLVVTEDGCDGALEPPAVHARALEAARALLAAPTSGGGRDGADAGARFIAIPTAGRDDAGTAERVFVDPLRPGDFHVVLFGAGHVGRALVPVLAPIVTTLRWVDTRATEFPEAVPINVERIVTDAPDEVVDAARAGTWFVVMTHSHPIDEALTERILRRADFAWCGLIGSATKRRRFEQRLRARGIDPALLARLTCPIGIAGIRGKAPAVVALATAAQIVQAYEARIAAHDAATRTA